MSIKNEVAISSFAKKHYLEKIENKNKKFFDILWENSFFIMLHKMDELIKRGRNKTIANSKNIYICKLDFKIEPHKSAKSSGSRCIVAWNKNINSIKVLLVYTKNEVRGKETAWWKKVINKNFEEYKDIV